MASCCQQALATDYDAELKRINDAMQLVDKKMSVALSANDTNQVRDLVHKNVHLIYAKGALTASYADFKRAEVAIEEALNHYPTSQDLYMLRANFNFKMHRLTAAERDLHKLDNVADGLEIRSLWADLDFQRGKYQEAEIRYKNILEDFDVWDAKARLAYYQLKTGHPDQALASYNNASDQLSAKEMRFFAWVELQKGLIDFEYGRYSEALTHYLQADREYSGYWQIEEHIAEVLNVLGRTRESIALYKKIIKKTNDPEFMGALAVILEKRHDKSAASYFQAADRGYAEQLALFPEAVSGHIINYWLVKKEPDMRLLEFALQNHRLRPNSESSLLLLKAYMKLGQKESAQSILKQILQTPWRGPEIERLVAELGVGTTTESVTASSH